MTNAKISIRVEKVGDEYKAIATLGGSVVAVSEPTGTKTGARCDVRCQLEEMGLLTDGVNANLGSR